MNAHHFFPTTTMTPCLPDDLIENILLQLPVKSLLRFQTVCKEWHGMITSQTFFKKHYLTYNMTHTTLILTHASSSAIFSARNNSSLGFGKVRQLYCYDNTSPSIKKPGLVYDSRVISGSYIIQSTCDSLICARTTMWLEPGAAYPCNVIHISNPFTGEHDHIPAPEILKGHCAVVVLAFDPTIHDYKLVLAPHTLKLGDVRPIHVVTMKTKAVQVVVDTTPYRLSFNKPAALDGFVYWVGKDLVEPSDYVILAFDLARNRLDVIPPPPTRGQGTCQKLQPYNGRLCLILYATDHHVLDSGGVIDVWVLEPQNGLSWRKERTIPKFPCPQLKAQLLSYNPIGLIHNGDLLMKDKLDGSLILYSPQKLNKVLKVDIENGQNCDVQLLEHDILANFLMPCKKKFSSIYRMR